MLTATAVCPGAPLLVPELSGADPAAQELRVACRRAIDHLLGTDPDLVAVIGPAAQTAQWPADGRLDVGAYGGSAKRDTGVPLSVGVGAFLLDAAGHTGERLLWTVAEDAPFGEIAATLAEAAPRVGVLAIADGSGRRTLKAPGYFDERAEPYDASVAAALSTGDTAALSTLDGVLARTLMAPGWPALQVLAHLSPAPGEVYYDAAPHGVGYLVTFHRRG
jgi:hypothetical protein